MVCFCDDTRINHVRGIDIMQVMEVGTMGKRNNSGGNKERYVAIKIAVLGV